MRTHLHHLVLAATVLGLSMCPRTLSAQTESSGEIGLSCGADLCWMFVREPVADQQLLSFGLRPADRSHFIGPARLRALVGTVHDMTMVKDDLHVFYSEGSHRRYRCSEIAGTPGVPLLGLQVFTEWPLPDAVKPLLIAGDNSNGHLYVVVNDDTARRCILASFEDQQAADENAEEDESDEVAAPPELPDGKLFLMRYAAPHWDLIDALPPDMELSSSSVLAVDQGRALFAYESGGAWVARVLDSGKWTPFSGSLPTSPSTLLSIHPTNDSWAFVALTQLGGDVTCSYHDESGKREIASFSGDLSDIHIESGWLDGSILLVHRKVSGETNQLRWSPEDGTVIEPLSSVSSLHQRGTGQWDQLAQDMALLFVLLGLLTYVFWTRPESISQELNLPSNYAVARLWQRFIAFALDVIPIATITSWMWWPQLLENMTDQYQILEVEGGPTAVGQQR